MHEAHSLTHFLQKVHSQSNSCARGIQIASVRIKCSAVIFSRPRSVTSSQASLFLGTKQRRMSASVETGQPQTTTEVQQPALKCGCERRSADAASWQPLMLSTCHRSGKQIPILLLRWPSLRQGTIMPVPTISSQLNPDAQEVIATRGCSVFSCRAFNTP